MVAARPSLHTAHMELWNQEIVVQIIAIVFAPLALIGGAVFGVAVVTGLAGRVILLVEDLWNVRDARRMTATRGSAPARTPQTPVRA